MSDGLTRKQLAQRFNVTVRTITNWLRQPDFPLPLTRQYRNREWSADEVDRWFHRTNADTEQADDAHTLRPTRSGQTFTIIRPESVFTLDANGHIIIKP